jgi:hypothetical protein
MGPIEMLKSLISSSTLNEGFYETVFTMLEGAVWVENSTIESSLMKGKLPR